MVYQGSKSKYTNEIVPILQRIIDENNIELYVEPFVGGANVIDKIKCKTKIGLDKNYSLIELHKQAQKDFNAIPEGSSSGWWYTAKDIYRRHKGMPSMEEEMEGWRIGAIQFLGSFNNGGFSRGYAKPEEGKREKYIEAYKNFKEQASKELYKDITFGWSSYENFHIVERALIYCDPPYYNTKPYGYAFETKFDYEAYWNWVRKMSKDNIVICSEQTFPDDFEIIWEKEANRTMNKENKFKAIERLGFWKESKFFDD